MSTNKSIAKNREEMIFECKKAILDLEYKISETELDLSALIDANKDKITERESIENQISSKKKAGKVFIILGVILAVAAVIGYFITEAFLPALVGIALCIALVAVGVFIFSGTKKFKDDMEKANDSLASFDKESERLSNVIYGYRSEIKNLENKIESIRMEEKMEKYDEWKADVEIGHVAVFASSSYDFYSSKPIAPIRGKKYGSTTLKDAIGGGVGIYIDGMLYGSIQKDFSFFELIQVEPGTHRFEVELQYFVGGSENFVQQTEPIPVKGEGDSVFYWCHLSTSQNGTQLFLNIFDDFDEFIEAIGITKMEVIKKYID